MENPKRTLASGVLVLGLMAVAVPAGHVEAAAPVETTTVETNDGFDWGWLGLLGLIGLAGLRGRNRVEHVDRTTATDRDARRP